MWPPLWLFPEDFLNGNTIVPSWWKEDPLNLVAAYVLQLMYPPKVALWIPGDYRGNIVPLFSESTNYE